MGSGYESGKCEGGGTHVGEDVLVFGKGLVRKAEVLSECVLDVETIVGVVVRCERLVGMKKISCGHEPGYLFTSQSWHPGEAD